MIRMKKQEIDINEVIHNQKLRKQLAIESHYWFFHIYLSHYVEYPTADFQKEMFSITEDESIQQAVIVAFRGSAKSTIFSLSYPLWSILGKPHMRHVVLLSQTSNQVKMVLKNIRRELENNELLRKDFGKLDVGTDEWKSNSIVIEKYSARISALSTGESIRGIRHLNYRPELIICDDIEDLQSVKNKEMRDKTSSWFLGDVIPIGAENTKVIVIGNLLHEDSLVVRLREKIKQKEFNGIFRSYPLIDDNNQVLWPGRFPNEEAINRQKQKVGDIASWSREYLLKIVSNSERVIHPEWIQYYDQLPKDYLDNLELIATGVDLAIKITDSSDYTTAVSSYLLSLFDGKYKIYILPNPINEKITFTDTVIRLKTLSKILGNGQNTLLYVEDVGYQYACIETLINEGFYVEGVKPKGQDKRARLALTSSLIQNGTIMFPRKGAESLINQLIGFGFEKHDDLVDAFTILILKLMEHMNTTEPQLYIVDMNG